MRSFLLAALATLLATVTPAQERSSLVGQRFPDLSDLTWLTSPAPSLGARGMLLVRWWTTGCPHCKASLPALSTLARQFDHVRLLAVFHQKGKEAHSDDALRKSLGDLGVSAAIARDQGWRVLKGLMARDKTLSRATSVSFLVDEWGRIRWVHPGPRVHPDPEGRHGSANADHQTLRRLLEREATRAKTDLRTMSFNVRHGKARDGDNSWPLRREVLLHTIQRFDPDLLATQEMLPGQRKWITDRLPGHFTLGRGRDRGGRGEQCTLFFRMSRFAVLGSGTFWLSPTPEEEASKGWDAALPRIATWARLKDQATGKTFRFVSTHFDHRGKRARAESASLLRARLSGWAKKEPLILGGDFNARIDSLPYRNLIGDGTFTDTFRAFEPDREEGTFHGFTGKITSPRRIDWILTSPHWSVRGAAVDRYHEGARWPSDHNPVTAVLSLRP